MEHLYNMITTQLSWITTPSSHHDQSLDSPVDDFCDPFLAQLPWSTPIQPSEDNNGNNVQHRIESDSAKSMDKQQLISAAHMADQTGLSKHDGHIETFTTEAEHWDTDSTTDSWDSTYHPPDPRYNSNIHKYLEKTPSETNDHYSSDFDDQSSTESEDDEQPEEPTLSLDKVEWTCNEDACKAGKMPMMCLWCYRFEDKKVEEVEDEDMVLTKCFMIGNRVFFKKERPSWAQCGPCGYGRPKKEFRDTKKNRIKKMFCKLTGKTIVEKPRTGYKWYLLSFRKQPYVDIDTWYANKR